MHRRTVLASGVGAIGTLTAGCSGVLGDTVELSDPAVTHQDDGRETYLAYREGEDDVVTVGFDQRSVPGSPTGRFGVRIVVEHSDETTIDAFQFDLRAPRSSVQPPADIYLQSPGGANWPALTFRETRDGWTRIALSDTGAQGDGTLTLETVLDPHGVSPDPIGVQFDLDLSVPESRPTRTYRVATRTTVDIVSG